MSPYLKIQRLEKKRATKKPPSPSVSYSLYKRAVQEKACHCHFNWYYVVILNSKCHGGIQIAKPRTKHFNQMKRSDNTKFPSLHSVDHWESGCTRCVDGLSQVILKGVISFYLGEVSSHSQVPPWSRLEGILHLWLKSISSAKTQYLKHLWFFGFFVLVFFCCCFCFWFFFLLSLTDTIGCLWLKKYGPLFVNAFFYFYGSQRFFHTICIYLLPTQVLQKTLKD